MSKITEQPPQADQTAEQPPQRNTVFSPHQVEWSPDSSQTVVFGQPMPPRPKLEAWVREMQERLFSSGFTTRVVLEPPSPTPQYRASFVSRRWEPPSDPAPTPPEQKPPAPPREIVLSKRMLALIKKNGRDPSVVARAVLAHLELGGCLVVSDAAWERIYQLLPLAADGTAAPSPLTDKDGAKVYGREKHQRLIEHVFWADAHGAIAKVGAEIVCLLPQEYGRASFCR